MHVFYCITKVSLLWLVVTNSILISTSQTLENLFRRLATDSCLHQWLITTYRHTHINALGQSQTNVWSCEVWNRKSGNVWTNFPLRLELSRIEFEIIKLALWWWWQRCFISRVMAHNYTERTHCNLHRSGGVFFHLGMHVVSIKLLLALCGGGGSME